MNRTPLAIALATLALVACPTPEGPDTPEAQAQAVPEPLPDGARPMATAVPDAPMARARRVAPADDALAALPALQTQDCGVEAKRERSTGLRYGRGGRPKPRPAARPMNKPSASPVDGLGGGLWGLGGSGCGGSG